MTKKKVGLTLRWSVVVGSATRQQRRRQRQLESTPTQNVVAVVVRPLFLLQFLVLSGRLE